jgi:hypothetical protein
MSYMPHIENLYKNQEILLFKECFALEKIHGTNSKLVWNGTELQFHSGGTKHETFVNLFNADALKTKLIEMGLGAGRKVTIYGESYGGKEQGMSETYGKDSRFVAYDVHMDEKCWLDVPKAEGFVKDLGLEFVHYVKVSTDLAALDAERDAWSVQAIRNGVSMVVPEGADFDCPAGTVVVPYGKFGDRLANPKMREGVVLRPLMELTKNNGARVICKHKGEKFQETKTPRPVVDPAKQQIWEGAEKIADEYVTNMRLVHVLDKMPGHSIEKMRDIIAAMQEDVLREGAGEFVDSKEVRQAIGKKTAVAYKDYLKGKLSEQAVS